MISKLANHLFRLVKQLLFEAFGLRIQTASHCEILPNHYSVSVAEIEKFVVLVNITAPTTQYITANILY